VPGNRVSEARAQHHEGMLAFCFGRSGGSPHGVVKTPQLATRTGIQIAHTTHDNVRLVIQIQAVADQLVQIDLGRTFRTTIAARPPVTAPVTTSVAARTPAAISTTLWTWTPITTTAGRTIFATAICLFFSHVSLRSYSLVWCLQNNQSLEWYMGLQLRFPDAVPDAAEAARTGLSLDV
jgi:hypothetical protein